MPTLAGSSHLLPSSEAIAPLELTPNYDYIKTEVEAKGRPLTFAEFMQLSLYGPDGFYSSGDAELNATGKRDFITEVEQTPFLGIAMANWLHSRWQNQGKPDRFVIVEPGAGSGIMACTILDEIGAQYPDFAQVARYIIEEIAPGMIKQQQTTLEGYPVHWVNGSATELPFRNIQGAIISDELPDAFPAHLMVRRGSGYREIYINLTKEGHFYELESVVSSTTLDPLVRKTIERQHIGDGDYFTVCPLAEKFIKNTLGALAINSSVLTVDYGYLEGWWPQPASEAVRYYSRWGDINLGRGANRLISYQFPGRVDMTTDVDFAALDAAARASGGIVSFAGTQAEFMDAHGNDEAYDRIMQALARGERSPGEVFEKHFAGYMKYMEGRWNNDWRPTILDHAESKSDGWSTRKRGKPTSNKLVATVYTKTSDSPNL